MTKIIPIFLGLTMGVALLNAEEGASVNQDTGENLSY